MPTPLFFKAGLLTVALVTTAVLSWEAYLRHKGLTIDYDDGESLWSDKRAMVYEPSDQSTVFIGSSRIKFDLDIATWTRLTGDHAIQLAMEGNSPLPALEDLAHDKNFKGKLVVDVTEGLFFSLSPRATKDIGPEIAYYKKRTPAQRFSFRVNHVLESQFVFLDKYSFSLNALLDRLHIPDRKAVFTVPIFPTDFKRVTFDRQDSMTQRFVSDSSLQDRVKNIWFLYASMRDAPISGKPLDSLFHSVKTCVDAIKARGGQVLFVRTPSSGPVLQGENMGFPRTVYWDRLLAITQCPGIHFTDYPAIAHFRCPEFSHLSPRDGMLFTENLVSILKEKGWAFPKGLKAP